MQYATSMAIWWVLDDLLYLFPFLITSTDIPCNSASVKIEKIKFWCKPEIISVETAFMCYSCDDIYNTMFVTMQFHHLININLPLRKGGKNIKKKKRQMQTFHNFWFVLIEIVLFW